MENRTLFDQVADSADRTYRFPKGIELIVKNKQHIIDLCLHYQVDEFFVFGSSINQNFSAESDFDFLVNFKKMPVDLYTDSYFGLHEELEKIFQRKVDLLQATLWRINISKKRYSRLENCFMLLEQKKLLLDIQVAANSITDYLGENRDFKVFQASKMLRRAVERELEIIGEATNKLLKLNPDIPISEARRIVNLRNWGNQ